MSKKQYTAAFIFDPQLKKVLLIKKNRPEWQAGLLNGIGGKLEPGETIEQGISREVWEECGLTIEPEKWTRMAELGGPDWVVDFFTYQLIEDLEEVSSITDEQVGWYSVDSLPDNLIANLKWLVPLAIYSLTDQDFKFAKVDYNQHV